MHNALCTYQLRNGAQRAVHIRARDFSYVTTTSLPLSAFLAPFAAAVCVVWAAPECAIYSFNASSTSSAPLQRLSTASAPPPHLQRLFHIFNASPQLQCLSTATVPLQRLIPAYRTYILIQWTKFRVLVTFPMTVFPLKLCITHETSCTPLSTYGQRCEVMPSL